LQARAAVVEAGWVPTAEGLIDTSELPDGAWELATALGAVPEAIEAASRSERLDLAVWVQTQQEALERARSGHAASLGSWWLTARR
jgi:hypothetical protein